MNKYKSIRKVGQPAEMAECNTKSFKFYSG